MATRAKNIALVGLLVIVSWGAAMVAASHRDSNPFLTDQVTAIEVTKKTVCNGGTEIREVDIHPKYGLQRIICNNGAIYVY